MLEGRAGGVYMSRSLMGIEDMWLVLVGERASGRGVRLGRGEKKEERLVCLVGVQGGVQCLL